MAAVVLALAAPHLFIAPLTHTPLPEQLTSTHLVIPTHSEAQHIMPHITSHECPSAPTGAHGQVLLRPQHTRQLERRVNPSASALCLLACAWLTGPRQVGLLLPLRTSHTPLGLRRSRQSSAGTAAWSDAPAQNIVSSGCAVNVLPGGGTAGLLQV
jgi:hypothetical protein